MFFMIEAMLNIVGDNNPGIVRALEKILGYVFPRWGDKVLSKSSLLTGYISELRTGRLYLWVDLICYDFMEIYICPIILVERVF